jgi:DNA-binding transcriptional regulator YhcF (GntR family)
MQTTRRYNQEDVSNNLFYQMPKFLFEGELRNLSNDARVLYSLLKDRHELSLKNNWINEEGEVYFIFSRESMCEVLGLSDKTVTKAINHLKKHDLIEEERRGQGKPNLIFLKVVTVANTKKRKIYDLENGENTIDDSENFRPNKNYNNNTNINNNQLVSPAEKSDEQTNEQTQEINQIITNARVDSYESEEMKETVKEIIKDCYIDEVSRQRIRKLKLEHIDRAIASYRIAQEEKEIKNPRLYFKKCLLSAIEESGLKGLF